MTTALLQDLTPQQRLANIVAEVTDDGRRVVQFFMRVAECRLDSEGFQPNHRMDAAKELVKIGLTEFEDYIAANPSPPKRRKSRRKAQDISPEVEQAREELAQYARELTDDGRTVIRLYSEIMDGFRNDENFKPHHRIAAGRELLLRGFGPVSAWTQPEPAPADSQITDHHQNQTNHRRGSPLGNHSSDHASESQTEAHPSLSLTPTVSEYLSDAVEAYEEQSPLRQLLPQDILDIVDSEDRLDDCPCAIAESEDRDIPCPENEECPYYDLEFPKFTEEQRARIKEEALRGLQMRAEMLWGAPSPSEDDP